MEQERKVILKVETGDSKKTVKSLKQDISDLKDAILNLEQGTDEYNSAVEELQQAQRDLNRVQSLTKESAVALEGSYDALTHQMALLKKEWKATNDEVRRNELGVQIDEINTKLKEFDANIGNFQRNVGNYPDKMGEMTTTTVSFGEAMRNMNETIEPTKAKFESVQKVAAGLASGFAAVKGVSALLGIENENLEKTFIKLQAAMAIAQGVGGIGDLIEGVGRAKVAFEGLGTTIKTVSNTLGKTGWLAVVMVAISAIMLITDKIKKKRQEVDTLNESLDKLAGKNEDIVASDNERARQLERDIKLMEAQGATEEEVLNKRLEYNQLYLDASEKNYKEAQKQYLGLKNSLEMGIKGVKQEDVDKAKEIYDASADIFEEYSEKRKDILNDIVIAQLKAKKDVETIGLPELGDVEIEDEEIVVEDETPKLQEEGEYYKRKGAALAAIEKTYSDLARKNKEDASNYEVTIEERKLAKIKELHQQAIDAGDYSSQVLLAQEIADQELAVEEAKYAEEERMRQENLAAEEAAAQKRIEITNKVASALSAAGSVTQGILEITQAAAEKDGEITEKEAKKIKGMQIAVATMNMLAGITAAISGAFTTKTGPWDIALAAVQAASIAAAGTANIMKIKNTDLAGSVPSGAQAAVTPNSNIFGTDLPMSYVRNVTTASEVDALNQDTRVYILESDIQASNKKVSVRESESSF